MCLDALKFIEGGRLLACIGRVLVSEESLLRSSAEDEVLLVSLFTASGLTVEDEEKVGGDLCGN